ncbi:MAG: hypothetical protein CBC92_002545 [Euryarchaeota archaeon TMED132]|nr:hypothetical protein [Euryarchaeota archaeon]RAH07224.1 MAG: hypothetical protein CBC92_002545 [Euryarchaeota archaeon TMED132]
MISPVALSNSMPAGKSSYESIDHDVGAPSVYVGAAALTILFLVNVYGEPGYEIEDGASSRTDIVIVVEISSAELFAHTVNIMAECIPVGVPVMIPFAGLKESPGIEEERTGSISHVLTAPPTLVGVAPLAGSFLVKVNGELAYEMSAASS